MADISSYIEYFRRIATEHKEINGFYMMDINEILDGLRSTVKYPALILENISGSYMASNLDNPLEVINGGFLIIDHLPNPDDFQGEVTIIDRMKLIGHQVIARMLHDKMKCEPLAEKAIPGFDVNSVTFEVIGPVFDNDYGLVFSFKILDCLDFEYDSEKYNN
ncbi:MAG: hypothetical protein EOM90_11405 [Alphaproteobacteria bacterium]|nr:hypothetical protein [Alphaproteobacteria bacterium]